MKEKVNTKPAYVESVKKSVCKKEIKDKCDCDMVAWME